MTTNFRQLFLTGRSLRASPAPGRSPPTNRPAVRAASSTMISRGEELRARARADQRQRIKAIITSEAGARSPALAQRLAFEGDLSSSDAIVLLEGAPDREVVAKTTSKDIIAAAELARDGGPERALPPRGTLARQIIEAGKNRRGEI